MLAQALCTASRPPRSASRRRTRSSRRARRSSGRRLAFAIVFALLAWKAWPAIKKALQDREDKIRGDLEQAESARDRGRDVARRLPASARRRPQRGQPDHRGGPPVGRAGAQGPASPAAEAEAAELRLEASDDIRLATERAMADLQGKVPSCRSSWPRRSSSSNLDRDTQIRAHRELHQPGREQLAVPSSPRASRRTPTRCSRCAAPKVSSADRGRPVPLRADASRAPTSCAPRSPIPRCPTERRIAVVEELLGGKALQASVGAGVVHRRRRPRQRAARDRRPVRGAGGGRAAARGRRGAHRDRRSRPSRQRLARRARTGRRARRSR